MKKRIFSILFAVLVGFSFAGCARGLPAPQNLRLDTLNNILSWDAVDGAASYVVNAEEKNFSVLSNEFALDNLESGTHGLKVKAVSERGEESAWSEVFTYTKEETSLLELKLINANSEYEVVGAGLAGAEIVIGNTYRGLPITSIGEGAFSNNDTVTRVVLGENVREIGENAFKNCSELENVQFSAGLESIGANAFQGCTALLSADIPDSVTEIGAYAFAYCSSLKSLELSDNLQSLENSVFADCRDLESVIVPGGVRTVGELAFSGNESMRTLTLCEGIESIGEGAFYGCESLNEVSVPSSVKTIGDMAFMESTNLTEVTLAEGVEEIGAQSFYGCEKLTDVSLPSSLTSIGSYAFDETAIAFSASGLVYIGGWVVGNNDTSVTEMEIEEGTVGIADVALKNLSALRSVTLPDSLRYIGSYNFQMSTNLGSVVWGNGVREISEYAFFGCRGLNVTALPESVERIGQNAFTNTMNWTQAAAGAVVTAGTWALGVKDEPPASLIVAEGVTGIADYAFAGKEAIAEVSLPQTLRVIGEGAFRECAALQAVILPDGIAEIAPYAFYKCGALAQVTLPQSVTEIGRSAFYETAALAEITLPENLCVIGDFAFYGSGLRTLNCPPSLLSIGECAFYRNEALESVALNEGLKGIGAYAFYRAKSLKSITIPDSVQTIGMRAFYSAAALEQVVIGNGVLSIGGRKVGIYRRLRLYALQRNRRTAFAAIVEVHRQIRFRRLFGSDGRSTARKPGIDRRLCLRFPARRYLLYRRWQGRLRLGSCLERFVPPRVLGLRVFGGWVSR